MTKMVQLSDDAYRRLRMLKRQGESFSDTVLRLAGRGDLAGLKGLRSRREILAAEKAIRDIDELDRVA